MYVSEPTKGYLDDIEIEETAFYKVLNFIEKEIGKRKLNKHTDFNSEAIRYLCPECTRWIEEMGEDSHEAKWSFLTPNKPESEKIKCLICNKEYIVKREKCSEEDCKGNVMSNYQGPWQCLT